MCAVVGPCDSDLVTRFFLEGSYKNICVASAPSTLSSCRVLNQYLIVSAESIVDCSLAAEALEVQLKKFQAVEQFRSLRKQKTIAL